MTLDPGWKSSSLESGINNKHPGSATLLKIKEILLLLILRYNDWLEFNYKILLHKSANGNWEKKSILRQ
jgi:hypothetical protein